MPKLSVTVPHELTQEEAARRLQQGLESVTADQPDELKNLQTRWEGHTIHCEFHVLGMGVKGTVAAEPKSVSVHADLPMRAMLFKRAIEHRIREELSRLLV